MKVIAKNDWIYLRADFKNLTSEQHDFMSECYWSYAPWGEFDEEGDSPLYKAKFAKDNERAISKVFKYADRRHIEIEDEVYDVSAIVSKEAQKEREKEAEERAKKLRIEELKKTVERAYDRLKYGCGWCTEIKYEFGDHRCVYAGRMCRKNREEVEHEFYAKRESKITGLEPAYFANPYPCAGCKYIEAAQKAREELEELTK